MRRQPIDYHHDPRTGPDPYIQRTYSSHLQDDELSDYSSTRPTDRTCSLSRKKISTSMRQQLVYYSENIRLLRYSKKQIKTTNIKATSRLGINSKESTVHQSVKSTSVDSYPHKSQEHITTIVQASSAGSKLLITLSAMGFISMTYSENRSSEQPTATPSPIKDKFTEGRKDLTNRKT